MANTSTTFLYIVCNYNHTYVRIHSELWVHHRNILETGVIKRVVLQRDEVELEMNSEPLL